MKPPLPHPLFMVITDRRLSADLPSTVARAFDGGAKWILLREKDMAPEPRLDLARRLKGQADRHGALFGVNSDLAAARAIGAANVHFPEDADRSGIDAANLLVGASVHDIAAAEAAWRAGADYLLLAPIFVTESKIQQRPPLGLAQLRAIAAAVPIPVIALGGILPEQAASCLDAGATGIAAMGGVMRAADAKPIVEQYLEAFTR